MVLNYCDGNSFAGARAGNVTVDPGSGRELTGTASGTGYTCMEGALTAGNDLGTRPLPNLAAAEAHCTALANCIAFTYELNSTKGAPLKVYFKSSLAGNGDAVWRMCWQDDKVPNLRLRGKANLDASLQTLVEQFGLAGATEVLLTGSSAGGLATYLHADHIHAYLKKTAKALAKYKVLPDSGFFVDHLSTRGEPVIEHQFRSIYAFSNASLPPACLAARPPADAWQCNFAAGAYATTAAPLFVVQSALDLWQTGCVMTAGASPYYCANCSLPEWKQCMPFWRGSFVGANCTHSQMALVRSFQVDVIAMVTNNSAASKAGNGMFVHGCHDHCIVFHNDRYTGHAIHGISAAAAVAAWWRDSSVAAAATHSHVDHCLRNWNGSPCNPTCGNTSAH